LPVLGVRPGATTVATTARCATLPLRIFAFDFDAIFYFPALSPLSL
jgi:hypothetical protein